MKLSKIRSVILALSAALILAALYLCLTAVNGGMAYAEETDGLRFSEYEGQNFVYSAEFTPANDEAEAGLVIGIKDNFVSYWLAAADLKEGKVKLLHSEDGELKYADYGFTAGKQFKLTVVMNGDIAKVFIDNSDIAAISCKLDNYAGGKLGLKLKGDLNLNKVEFVDTDLPECDIYCNGYDVLKVVNITDGNYKLKDGEYTVKAGNLTVSREYLKTLESNTEYVFRAVTSFTDFDFKITTDFTSVTATPAVEKYYRDNAVTLELSGNVKVHKLLIDGKECAFKQENASVVISAEETNSLTTGNHTVKLYTEKGRPETTITVSEIVQTITEPVVKSAHVWLWIDFAIFLSAIVGYTAFSVISKRKKK